MSDEYHYEEQFHFRTLLALNSFRYLQTLYEDVVTLREDVLTLYENVLTHVWLLGLNADEVFRK